MIPHGVAGIDDVIDTYGADMGELLSAYEATLEIRYDIAGAQLKPRSPSRGLRTSSVWLSR